MRILFIHQNFPGQFVHLAAALKSNGHDVLALTANSNLNKTNLPTVRYRWQPRYIDKSVTRLGTHYVQMAERGEVVVQACRELVDRNAWIPDLIVGHPGWGETLFVKDVWPNAKTLLYGEFYYRSRGLDTDFDSEFYRESLSSQVWVTSRQAAMLHAIGEADAVLSPTHWQASTFPEIVKPRLHVIHDGINTDAIAPSPDASVMLPGTSVRFNRGDELLTFINRNLEPYRGFHIFMRALPKVLAARPNAQVVIVGGDDVSYGNRAASGKSWKEQILSEIGSQLDPGRVHFTGRVPYKTFLDLMRVTRVHAYLTVPFVLSWSMLEAMSAGALVIGSRTAPVEEVIEHGQNGLLVDFFDVSAWVDNLTSALADPERFEALRLAGRRTVVDHYDLHRICLPRQLELVETLLRKGGTRHSWNL